MKTRKQGFTLIELLVVVGGRKATAKEKAGGFFQTPTGFGSFTLIELLVVVAIISLLVSILLPTISRAREMARRAVCASNLRQIGIAMTTYAQTERDSFPRLSTPDGIVGTNSDSPSHRNLNRNALDYPFGNDPSGQQGALPSEKSVSACVWLLCRTAYSPMPTKLFVCPSVSRKASTEDPLTEDDGLSYGSVYFSDFYSDERIGPLLTYSFQNPWQGGRWTTSVKPGFVIGGDANNGEDPRNGTKGSNVHTNHMVSNSMNHMNNEGQNLLVPSGRVFWAETVHAGLNEDNVYTAHRDGGQPVTNASPLDHCGELNVAPSPDYFDTVLVPNDESILAGWER